MRFLTCTILILLFSLPAQAETTAEQRAHLELISARIKTALADEPYVVEESCVDEKDCTISIRR